MKRQALFPLRTKDAHSVRHRSEPVARGPPVSVEALGRENSCVFRRRRVYAFLRSQKTDRTTEPHEEHSNAGQSVLGNGVASRQLAKRRGHCKQGRDNGQRAERRSPMPRTERKSRPDFHRSLQNTAPAPKAPSVDYTPEIYRSLLPPDYAEQVRRMMMTKAAA